MGSIYLFGTEGVCILHPRISSCIYTFSRMDGSITYNLLHINPKQFVNILKSKPQTEGIVETADWAAESTNQTQNTEQDRSLA